MKSPHEKPITKAVENAGGQSALARQLDVSPQAVQQWLKKGRAPAERVLAISKATGITPHELRPDIYPSEIKSSRLS